MPRETEKPSLAIIDGEPTDGTSTSKKDQDGHGMRSLDFFLKKLEEFRTQAKKLMIFFPRWSWSDECCFFLD